jgi:hypothetical protein
MNLALHLASPFSRPSSEETASLRPRAADPCCAAFRADRNLRQPLVIALLTVPIVIQVYLNAGVTHTLNRALRLPHAVACQIVAGTPAAI